MPCYDPRPADDARVNKQRLDEVTRMLCALCDQIEEAGTRVGRMPGLDSVDGLWDWWESHKKADEARRSK